MVLKIDKKPRFKTLRLIFFKYYRFSITDFFGRFSSLKKFKSSNWKKIKKNSFFLRKKNSKSISLKNNNVYLSNFIKYRFNYIAQNQSFLLYTRFAGKKKKRYITDMYNFKLNMKLFNFKNKIQTYKNINPIIFKSKGNKYYLFKNLIKKIDNKLSLFLFRHYFMNTLNQSENFIKQKYIKVNLEIFKNPRRDYISYGSFLNIFLTKIEKNKNTYFLKDFKNNSFYLIYNKEKLKVLKKNKFILNKNLFKIKKIFLNTKYLKNTKIINIKLQKLIKKNIFKKNVLFV